MTNRLLVDFGAMLDKLPFIPTMVVAFLTIIILWAFLIGLLMFVGRK